MLEKVKQSFLDLIASAVYRVALTDANSNSWYFVYQAEIPEELLQDVKTKTKEK